jgi:hypothetical protein
MARIDPPQEFPPKILAAPLFEAMQLEQGAFVMITFRAIAIVNAHELVVKVLEPVFPLHAYAPTYRALIDPPYELTPTL